MSRCVYLMKSDKYYKIGVSQNPERRAKDLNNRPYKTILIVKTKPFNDSTASIIEKELHSYLKGYRVGGEWFNLPIQLVCDVANILLSNDTRIIYGG